MIRKGKLLELSKAKQSQKKANVVMFKQKSTILSCFLAHLEFIHHAPSDHAVTKYHPLVPNVYEYSKSRPCLISVAIQRGSSPYKARSGLMLAVCANEHLNDYYED